MASAGLRVRALTRKRRVGSGDAEGAMEWLGLVGIMDPPRAEAKAAVQTCWDAGITPVMITGDHPLTATALARELGLLDGRRVVSGQDLSRMSDEDLAREVADIGVYVRVSPADKMRIVSAWQGRGDVVAMTGEVVNDAPALKKADVGMAMGISGTDVSKEAASVTFLYVNLATDGLPALALALDPPESGLMRRQPRDPRAGVFTRPLVVLLLIGGVRSALVNIGLFAWMLQSGRPLQEAMAMTFVSLVLIQFFKAYNYRFDRFSVFRRPFANRWLNSAVGWELLLLAVIVYLPFLQQPFGKFTFACSDWALAGALAFTIVPVLELVKWLQRSGCLGEPK